MHRAAVGEIGDRIVALDCHTVCAHRQVIRCGERGRQPDSDTDEDGSEPPAAIKADHGILLSSTDVRE
jgi:hypothetical protein